MGKKSSQKKQKKIHQTEEKDSMKKKSVENSSTKSQKEAQSSLNYRFTKLPQKTLALLLVIAGLIALGFFTIFIWGELTKPLSIAKFIPPDAVGFAEFDTNLTGENWQNYHSLTEGKSVPSISTLIEKINSTFNVDIMKDVYPWLSRRAGIALLSDKSGALFLEVRDEKQALNFFRQHRLASITEDLQEEVIDGVKTYHYIASSPIALTFLGNYLVIASDDKAIAQIIRATKKAILFNNSDFQRINNAVPQKNRLGFIFGRPGQIAQTMESLPGILSETFMGNLIAEGASIKALNNVFVMEHLALFSKKNWQTKESMSTSKKFKAELISALSDKTQLYMGGINIASVSDKMSMIFSKRLTAYVDAFIEKTFDGDISPEEIKTLLSGEYAFAIDDGQFKAVIELTNPPEQEKTLKKMIKGIEASRIFFPPTIENDTVKGSSKTMKTSKEAYKNFTIRSTEVTDESPTVTQPEAKNTISGIYLAINGNRAIITLSMDAMKRTIDTMNGSTPGLKNTKSFTDYIQPQLQSADDIMYARPRELTALPEMLRFLANISEISLATNSFEDGMKTIIFFSP